MRRLSATLLMVILGSVPASSAANGIPCTCRYDGRDMAEGATVCIDLPSGTYLARCVRVLNNTAWRRIADGCPSA